MTDREIMQQALHALYSAPLDHNSIKSRFFERRHHAIIALRERLAQPEQEPVAVIKRNEAGQITMQTTNSNPFDMSKYIGAKLYTAPQQREWQGLTENEMKKLADTHLKYQIESYEVSGVFDLIRAVEAKLKEKND